MYFVALTRSNVNPALAFEYMFQLIKILKAYLGEDFDENHMRNNMTLIYELMDETMDFGYPQVRGAEPHTVAAAVLLMCSARRPDWESRPSSWLVVFWPILTHR